MDKIPAHRYAFSLLYTNTAMKRLFKEIAPRYDEMQMKGGYTRIEAIGRREPDGAKMAIIELVNNPIEQYERQLDAQAADELGHRNFWQWELKVLQQEQEHFK